MAEALPRYQRPGVLLGEVPRYDMAHIREAARGSAQLNESLNRLSAWAFGEAEKEAKERGEQYGAENPVTVQQLLDGTANIAKKGTVFGDAARDMQLDALTTDISIESHNRLAELKARSKLGEIDAINAIAEISDMQDGYASALAQMSPKAALKFRGNFATAGNSVVQSIQEEAGKRALERQKVSLDNWTDATLPELVRSAIEAGDTTDPDSGRTITPKMRLQPLKATVREALVQIGDAEYARGVLKRFDDAVESEMVGAVVSFANSPDFARRSDGTFDAVGAVARADRGDFGRLSSVYQALDHKQQASVRAGLRSVMADRYTQGEHERVQLKHAQGLEANGLITEYVNAAPTRKREIVSRLKSISIESGAITGITINELTKPKEDAQAKPNEQAEFRVRAMIASGQITSPDQIEQIAIKQLGMPWKQANEMITFLYSHQNREYNRGIALLTPGANLGVSIVNPAQSRAQNTIGLQREFDQRFSEARRAHEQNPQRNPPPVGRSIADEILKERQASPHQKAIDDKLNWLNDQYGAKGATKATGITFTEDMDKVGLRQTLEARGVPKSQIDTILNRLREVEIARMQLNKLEAR